jgi:hypothetical protein
VSVLLPGKSRFRALQVSLDGRQIATILVQEGKQQIWIRALDSLEFSPLAGTDGAESPFWSPDSRYIGFFADAKVKKIERSGGPVQTLCDALGGWAEPGIATAISCSQVTLWDGCSEFWLPEEHQRTSLTIQVTPKHIHFSCPMNSTIWPGTVVFPGRPIRAFG